MDLTTRCPHCGTTFPASLEQLQLRKGYIRCISCANIFDGYEAVVSGDAAAAPARAPEPPFERPAPLKGEAGEPASTHGAPADKAEPPAQPSHTISEAGGAAASGAARSPAFTISAAPYRSRDDDRLAAQPEFHIGGIVRRRADQRDTASFQEDAPAESGAGRDTDRPVWGARHEPVIGAPSLPADTGRQTHYVAPPSSAAATPPVHANEPVIHPQGQPAARHDHDEGDHREPVLPIRSRTETAGHRPGEVYMAPRVAPGTPHGRDDDRRAGARRRAGTAARVFWRALVILGVVLLLAQLVYVYRAQIANQIPVFRPMLERACVSLNCHVPYAREIDAIAIMNSALRAETASSSAKGGNNGDQNSGPADTMILSLTLRNSYDKPQEWPTLVLGLTDFSGTLVVRKNLPPEAYLPPEIAAQPFAAGSEITARVPIALNEHKVSGYQLDKFFQ